MLEVKDIENLLKALDYWETETSNAEIRGNLFQLVLARNKEQMEKAIDQMGVYKPDPVRLEIVARLRVKLYDLRDALINKEVNSIKTSNLADQPWTKSSP